ncbi:MAG: AAA family ATPase [Candidatus Omnitrophica bacterium]|jgi:energy-coupling factor transporter ATP-binding protein EcfA2|nr:AAA family ATPase [Candidatus Omnitrophota bacterium]
MKSSNLVKTILQAIKTKTPVLILGAPGIGKSAIVNFVAANMKKEIPGFMLVDVRTALYQPVDIKGLPTVEGDSARWTKPDFFRTIKAKSSGILFLDELTAARPEVQAALYELVYDRRIGEYVLPEGWTIVAAGNRTSDRAVAFTLSTALASRFVQVDLDVDVDEWIEWALGAGIDERVIGFLKLRPALLHNFDPQTKARAFACPRTWEYVSRSLAAGLGPEIEFDYVAGLIGEGAATEFIGVLRLMDSMPDPDEALERPGSFTLPEKPAVMYAFAVCLARRAKKENADAFFAIANLFPGDYAVLMIQTAIKFNPTIQKTGAFVRWAAKNKNVLI